MIKSRRIEAKRARGWPLLFCDSSWFFLSYFLGRLAWVERGARPEKVQEPVFCTVLVTWTGGFWGLYRWRRLVQEAGGKIHVGSFNRDSGFGFRARHAIYDCRFAEHCGAYFANRAAYRPGAKSNRYSTRITAVSICVNLRCIPGQHICGGRFDMAGFSAIELRLVYSRKA
jgi:hypothetical protein